MVGVAGRSKACHSCRKRRVACGRERPDCVRCLKAGIECPGYTRRALFVNRTITNPSTTAQDVIGTSGSGSDEATQDVVDDYRNMSRAFASSTYDTGDFRRTAFRILCRLYLPRKGMTDESLAMGASSWVTALCSCVNENSTLDLSLLALCAAQLYINRHGDITLDEALGVYSSGLSKLAAALQRVDTGNLASLLGSVVALSTCELFICPLTSGWRAHVQGIAQLLRFRTDLDHQGAPVERWVQLCARARIMSVLTSMMSQTRTSVTPGQWHAVMPGRLQADPLGDLLDIVTDLPALYEVPGAFDRPVTSMLRILERIYDWERRFRDQMATAPYRFVPSRLSNPADEGYDEKLYPLVLEFSALQVASCLIISWGATLQTLSTIIRLRREGKENDPRLLDPVWSFLDRQVFKQASPETAIAVEAKRKAGLLCQCIEYTHREEMGSYGPQCMTYARGLLLRYFSEQNMTHELAWCHNIPHMTDQSGQKFAIQLLDFRA